MIKQCSCKALPGSLRFTVNLVPLLLFALYSSSCSKACREAAIVGVEVNYADTTLDTMVVLSEYEANSNFTKLISSDTGSARNRMYGHFILVQYNLVSQYNYIVSVYPINKQYKIKNIAFGSSSKPSDDDGASGDGCISSYTYTINDSLVFVPMRNYVDPSDNSFVIEIDN